MTACDAPNQPGSAADSSTVVGCEVVFGFGRERIWVDSTCVQLQKTMCLKCMGQGAVFPTIYPDAKMALGWLTGRN